MNSMTHYDSYHPRMDFEKILEIDLVTQPNDLEISLQV